MENFNQNFEYVGSNVVHLLLFQAIFLIAIFVIITLTVLILHTLYNVFLYILIELTIARRSANIILADMV